MYKALIRSMRSSKYAGREEILKEVLEWLDSNTYDSMEEDLPVQVDFTLKEDMLQSFKERFNIDS